MKRKILFVLSIIVSTVLLTGCDMPFSKKGNPNVPDGGHLYEFHVYNSSDALQTLISGMDIVAIYDKNGEFVSF